MRVKVVFLKKKIFQYADSMTNDLVIEVIILGACFLFLLYFFPPDVMLSTTTTTGGDMGSHYVLAQYLRDFLLPHFQVIGWYPDWMGGLPMFQFYFFPPYLLMALLSYLIPLEIAFKLVSVLGLFMLPFASFYATKWMGFKFPVPPVASALSLLFLFNESYTIYGGNIASTLAGEISYSFSFSLAFLFLAWLFRSIHSSKKARDDFSGLVRGAILLFGVIVTHVYTTIFVIFSSTYFALSFKKRDWLYLALVFAIGFGLSAFWFIPFVLKTFSASPPQDVFYGLPQLSLIFIQKYWFVYPVALMAAVRGILRRDDKSLFLIYAFVLSILFFFITKFLPLLYIRLVPFSIFTLFLLAASSFEFIPVFSSFSFFFGLLLYYLANTVNFPISNMLQQAFNYFLENILSIHSFHIPAIGALYVLGLVLCAIAEFLARKKVSLRDLVRVSSPLLAFIAVSLLLLLSITFVPSWIKWNYEGLENKADYPTFKQVNDFLRNSNAADGRIDFEYSAAYGSMGTPRVFEASPVFHGKPVMEALLLESSLTDPFFFYMQEQVSESTWWPGFPIQHPGFNQTSGAERLRLYNVKTFVAYSQKAKDSASSNPRYHLLKRIGSFDIFSLNEDSAYVEPLRKEPVLVLAKDWKSFTFRWFEQPNLDTFFVFPPIQNGFLGSPVPDAYDLQNFNLIIENTTVLGPQDKIGKRVYSSGSYLQALNDSRKIDSSCSASSVVDEEKISITTDCIGKPLLVKVSYFPNWQVDGARKVYLASPDLMVVFPEKKEVVIWYGSTWMDFLGNALTLIAVISIALVLYFRHRNAER